MATVRRYTREELEELRDKFCDSLEAIALELRRIDFLLGKDDKHAG